MLGLWSLAAATHFLEAGCWIPGSPLKRGATSATSGTRGLDAVATDLQGGLDVLQRGAKGEALGDEGVPQGVRG